MRTDENKYQHRPVSGLPKSLIEKDGDKVAVLALMQRQAGLNRERRREMQGGSKSNSVPADPIVKSISKSDWNVLTFYLNPVDRWGSFWRVVRDMLRQQSAAGTKAYAIAVDVQLLNAYESGWADLTLDAEVLTAVCTEWPRIREVVEEFWKRKGKEPMPLGVFMLWPRLIKDLEQWHLLDEGQRLRVGHAVFALSSIGWTGWFIDDALSRCSDLERELGELKSSASATPRDDAESSHGHTNSQTTEAPQQGGSESMESTDDLESEWARLGGELNQINSDWQAAPKRALLTRLSAISQFATRLLPFVPVDTVPSREVFEKALHELDHRLHEAAGGGELPWLGADDLRRIMARWRIALTETQDDAAVLELANDAGLALEPLRELFKDEVRKLGVALGLPHEMVYRHPFPGPGLGVRILGEVKREYADLLRRADAIFIEELRTTEDGAGRNWYDLTSQAFAVFLPVKSVGVMGDGRTYEYVVALRAVQTQDFMTAHWAHLPHDLLGRVSNRIINEVRGINRVVYDISGKPPATIEWE